MKRAEACAATAGPVSPRSCRRWSSGSAGSVGKSARAVSGRSAHELPACRRRTGTAPYWRLSGTASTDLDRRCTSSRDPRPTRRGPVPPAPRHRLCPASPIDSGRAAGRPRVEQFRRCGRRGGHRRHSAGLKSRNARRAGRIDGPCTGATDANSRSTPGARDRRAGGGRSFRPHPVRPSAAASLQPHYRIAVAPGAVRMPSSSSVGTPRTATTRVRTSANRRMASALA